MVREPGERVRGRLGLLALERAQALERHRGVRHQQRGVVDDLGRQRHAAAVAGEVAVRAGRGAQRQAEAAAFEIDAALVAAGLRQRHERGAVERVLARALVAQPGLRQHELALDDLADLHAGEPERTPDRAGDDAQHRSVLARLGEAREGLPQPARAGRLPRLGRLAAERVARASRRRVRSEAACASRARARRPAGRRARVAERLDERGRLDARAPLDDPVLSRAARRARARRPAAPTPRPAPPGGDAGART